MEQKVTKNMGLEPNSIKEINHLGTFKVAIEKLETSKLSLAFF